MGMGEMTEGRKCIACLGRRFSQRYITIYRYRYMHTPNMFIPFNFFYQWWTLSRVIIKIIVDI